MPNCGPSDHGTPRSSYPMCLLVSPDPAQDAESPLPALRSSPGVIEPPRPGRAQELLPTAPGGGHDALAHRHIFKKLCRRAEKADCRLRMGICGETRMSEASRYSATFSLGNDPVNITRPVSS